MERWGDFFCNRLNVFSFEEILYIAHNIYTILSWQITWWWRVSSFQHENIVAKGEIVMGNLIFCHHYFKGSLLQVRQIASQREKGLNKLHWRTFLDGSTEVPSIVVCMLKNHTTICSPIKNRIKVKLGTKLNMSLPNAKHKQVVPSYISQYICILKHIGESRYLKLWFLKKQFYWLK